MNSEQLYTECNRLRGLALGGHIVVIEDDGTQRPFLKSCDQEANTAWDRICHKNGKVWVEAWAGGYLSDNNAKARYLDFTET